MYCSKCGSEISASTTFCPTCGQAVGAGAALPSLSPVIPGQLAPAYAAPAPVVTPAAPVAVYGSAGYAGFWLRFVAYLIDGAISGVVLAILLVPLFFLSGAGAYLSKLDADTFDSDAFGMAIFAFICGFVGILLLVSWLYYAFAESSSWQGTVGKKILGLKVTDLQGQPVSFGRASGRFFARIITKMIPLGIGYIMAGFTEKKQAIHDMIASCLVLRNN